MLVAWPLLFALLGPAPGAAPALRDGADDAPDGARAEPAVDPRWLERLDPLDRALLDELIGSAPPAFGPELTWVGGVVGGVVGEGVGEVAGGPDGVRRTWADLRGRVVVIQSWTSRTAAGRRAPEQTARLLADFDADDVEIILLHTPEGRDTIQRYLERRPLGQTVVVDPRGAFCDALGVYRRPVNIVVDRNGVVRYAGLHARGLAPAVAALVAEAHDPDAVPPAPAAAPAAAFPPAAGPVGKAIDLRGKPAPPFSVEQWWTEKPDAEGKVVVLDFWATWCGPCVAAIPHMNALADRFRDDVCIIGISREETSKFERGVSRIRGRHEFHYALALDSTGAMQRAIDIRAIPHCVVISSDWTVRWQGHPTRLTPEILEQIVRANRGGADPRRRRWTH